MTIRAGIMKILQQDGLNFVLTNWLPRRWVTTMLGRFSRIENPLIYAASLRVWRTFSDLDLSEARKGRFRSIHDCFTRQLKDGARPIDMDRGMLVSPCDGIVGMFGRVASGQLLQVKGSSYTLADLLLDESQAREFEGGVYATLRLTSAMYHRFHSPYNLTVTSVAHIFGDVWNVNPAALNRVRQLYCRNERAVIRAVLSDDKYSVLIVPVAAILVAGIRLRFLDLPVERRHERQSSYECNAMLRKGDEMGWFEHGSTIIVLAPPGFSIVDGLRAGTVIRMGQPLLRLPSSSVASEGGD